MNAADPSPQAEMVSSWETPGNSCFFAFACQEGLAGRLFLVAWEEGAQSTGSTLDSGVLSGLTLGQMWYPALVSLLLQRVSAACKDC